MDCILTASSTVCEKLPIETFRNYQAPRSIILVNRSWKMCAWGVSGGEVKLVQCFGGGGNQKERDHEEDLGVDGRML